MPFTKEDIFAHSALETGGTPHHTTPRHATLHHAEPHGESQGWSEGRGRGVGVRGHEPLWWFPWKAMDKAG